MIPPPCSRPWAAAGGIVQRVPIQQRLIRTRKRHTLGRPSNEQQVLTIHLPLIVVIAAGAYWAWQHFQSASSASTAVATPAAHKASDTVKFEANAPQLSYLQVKAVENYPEPLVEALNARITYDDNHTARVYAPAWPPRWPGARTRTRPCRTWWCWPWPRWAKTRQTRPATTCAAPSITCRRWPGAAACAPAVCRHAQP